MSVHVLIKAAAVDKLTPKPVETSAGHGLDLILPCYNPPKGWVSTLLKHYHALKILMPDVPMRIILVNDGSLSNFGPVHVTLLQEHIPGIVIVDNQENRGKGYSIRTGLHYTASPLQIYTDLDFPFGVESVRLTYEQLLLGNDIVAGERGAAYLQMLPARRRVITRLSRAMNRILLQLKVRDAQAGLKGFNKRGYAVLSDTVINGFLYDSEFMYKAGNVKDLRIVDVPICCRPDISFSEFSWKLLLRECVNYLLIMLNGTEMETIVPTLEPQTPSPVLK